MPRWGDAWEACRPVCGVRGRRAGGGRCVSEAGLRVRAPGLGRGRPAARRGRAGAAARAASTSSPGPAGPQGRPCPGAGGGPSRSGRSPGVCAAVRGPPPGACRGRPPADGTEGPTRRQGLRRHQTLGHRQGRLVEDHAHRQGHQPVPLVGGVHGQHQGRRRCRSRRHPLGQNPDPQRCEAGLHLQCLVRPPILLPLRIVLQPVVQLPAQAACPAATGPGTLTAVPQGAADGCEATDGSCTMTGTDA